MSSRSSTRGSQIFDPDLVLRVKTPGKNEIFCTGKGRGKTRCNFKLDASARDEALCTLQKMSTMRPGKAILLLPELARLTLHCENHKSQADERVREWTKLLHRAESVIANGSTCSFPDFQDIENKHLRAALGELEGLKRELKDNKDRAKRQAKALRSLTQMHVENQEQLAAHLQRTRALDRELAASRTERVKLTMKLEKQERVYAALQAHHNELQAAFNDADEIHKQMLQKLRGVVPEEGSESVASPAPDADVQPAPAPDANIKSLARSVHRELDENQAYWQRTEAKLKERLSDLEQKVTESLQEAARAKGREEELLKDVALAKEKHEISEEGQRRAQSQLRECQDRLEECQSQLNERQGQLEECQNQLQECQSQLQGCKTEVEAQQSQLKNAQDEAQKLQGTLEVVQNRETKLSLDLDRALEKLKLMEKQQEDRNDYQRLSERLRTANALEASKLRHRVGVLEGQLSETVDHKVRGWVARFKERLRHGHQIRRRHHEDTNVNWQRRRWEW